MHTHATFCLLGKDYRYHPYLQRKYFIYCPDDRAIIGGYLPGEVPVIGGYLLDVVDLTSQVLWSACCTEDPVKPGFFFYMKPLVA